MGVELPAHVCERIAETTLGAMDDNWSNCGLKAVTHPDPFVNVQATNIAPIRKARSKNELLQDYATKADGTSANQHTVPSNELSPTPEYAGDADAAGKVIVEPPLDPRSADLTIVIEKPAGAQICTIGQLVDICESEEKVSDLF